MRFLFFNIVVGAALLYLYKGGDIDISRFTGTESIAATTVAANAPQTKKPKPGHARDVIEEPASPAPKPKPAPQKAKVQPPLTSPEKTLSKAPKTQALPAIEQEVSVAKRIPKKPVFNGNTSSEDPAITRRRAEVLGTGSLTTPTKEFALKEGTALMSAADRRRSLDTLAEEMEMMFLDQVGG